MSSDIVTDKRKAQIENADESLLAALGYKQEFQRAFTPLEVGAFSPHTASCFILAYHTSKVFGIAFSIVGVLPSIA